MSYFLSEPAGTTPFLVVASAEIPSFEVSMGVRIAPVAGERLNLNVVTLEPGAIAPVHTHPEEQLGYVVSGEVEFSDGTSTWTLAPGDCYHAAPMTPHGARALEARVVIIDVFSPPRAEVLALLGRG